MFGAMIPAIATLVCCQGCCSQQSAAGSVSCCPPSGRAASNVTNTRGGISNEIALEVELLALDLDTCDRCTGTDKSIEAAVTELRPALAEAGVDLRFTKTVVRTAEQASTLRFQSSPTVRINGRDLPIELRESKCGDCTTLCGGGPESTDCRVWVWRGREYTEAPKGLIVDAVLRAYPKANEKPEPVAGAFVLPENLRRFFDAKKSRVASDKAGGKSSEPCCDTKTCCEPSEKAACCGTTKSEKGRCGCKSQ